jgi:hypothetical protein
MRRFPLLASALFFIPIFCAAQSSPKGQRTFSQPAPVIRTVVKKLPGGTSGPLPVLDGFVVPGPHALDLYKRPYYQCEVRITPAPSGGSVVRVTTKITAWYSDSAHSGYEVLESNGRLESDLLDRLQDSLGAPSTYQLSAANAPKSTSASAKSVAPAPDISAPMPRLPESPAITGSGIASMTSSQDSELQKEAKNLEEILRNQSHPANLVAIKQDRSPVLQNPSSDAKVLFLARAEDEFEVLEANPDWVHVRISGLSRGWLQRSTVEMLDESEMRSTAPANNQSSIAAKTEKAPENAISQSPSLFSIGSEEVGSFPGEWAPLKGKSVKIISIQQVPGTGRITSPKDKLSFAETLFRKEAESSSAVAGVVLVFDAEDGGMVAATSSVLEQWKKDLISEQAFWKQCFLDPPEILGSAN